MKTKSNQQMFIEIGDEFGQLVIDHTVILIEAIANEDFESAITQRDYISNLIAQTVSISMPFIDIPEKELFEHYETQAKMVYDAINEKFNE